MRTQTRNQIFGDFMRVSLIYILLLVASMVHAQSVAKEFPKEEIRLELSKTSFIPGEEIFVSIRCFTTGQNFFISSIAYLELISPDNKSVLQKKVHIQKGLGDAQVYLPSHLSSGVYTIVVYTKWSRNFGDDTFAKRKINIINPFIPLPPQVTNTANLADTLAFKIYPEGGRFFKQNEQVIDYRIENRFGQLAPAQVSIKDASSNVVLDIQSEGNGTFKMIPEEYTSYNVVMVDSLGRVHFSRFQTENLPSQPCVVAETSEQIQITEIQTPQNSRLEIWNNGIKTSSIAVDRASYQINKGDLKKGLVQVCLVAENGETLYKISTYNQPERSLGFVQISEKEFSTGDSARVTIKVDSPIAASIVVRKKERFGTNESIVTSTFKNATDYNLTNNSKLENETYSRKPFLPDVGGELVVGKLKDQQGKPVPDHKFFVTLLSEDFRIIPLISDHEGTFKFVRSYESFSSQEMQFSNTNGYSIELESPFISDHDFVPRSRLGYYDPTDWLLEKAQQVQISNLFAQTNSQNELSQKGRKLVGYTTSENVTTYNLDEFTRFPTMADHIIEYVPNVMIRSIDGRREFAMRNVKNQSTDDQKILSTLNGVIWTPDDILDFNPALIEKFEVCINQFHFGESVYTGSINFMTFPDAFVNVRTLRNVSSEKYLEVGISNDYPLSLSSGSDRIPDMRDVLLWKPHIDLTETPQTFDFRASDISGTYEVVISGVKDDQFIYEVVEFEILDKK